MNNPSYNEEALLKEGRFKFHKNTNYLLVIQIYDVYLIEF